MAAIVLTSLSSARAKARYARSQEEFRSIATSLELYASDHGGSYPPDATRAVPPGLEAYLANSSWPPAVYAGSSFDWDAWPAGTLTYVPNGPGTDVYQISIRFCAPPGPPGICTIPTESWATGFDWYSALYFCVAGSCRAHQTQPVTYPGKCVNC